MPPPGKRTAPVTVHLAPVTKAALKHLSASDRRTVSTYIAQLVEEHPVVKVFIQRIGGQQNA